MNNTVVLALLSCTLPMPALTTAASLSCATYHGSGTYVTLNMAMDNQTPEWIQDNKEHASSVLHLDGLRNGMGWYLPVTEWWDGQPFVITLFNPDSSTHFDATLLGASDGNKVRISAPNTGKDHMFYPQTRLSAALRVDPGVAGYDRVEWTWSDLRVGEEATVRLDAAPFMVLKHSEWIHPDVIDMGTRSTGVTPSFVFSANPTPGYSTLSLDFTMEAGLEGSQNYLINGVPQGLGPTKGVNADAGPVKLEVEPSGIPGPFRGTVTATLKCN